MHASLGHVATLATHKVLEKQQLGAKEAKFALSSKTVKYVVNTPQGAEDE